MSAPIVSTCRIKLGKYLWGVWEDYDPKREDPPLISGFALTHEDARRQSLEAAGPNAFEDSGYANAWYIWNSPHLLPSISVVELGPGQVFWISFDWYDLRGKTFGPTHTGEGPTIESAYSQALCVAGKDARDLGEEVALAYRANPRASRTEHNYSHDKTDPLGPKSARRPRRLVVSHFEEQAFHHLGINIPGSADEVKDAYRAGALLKHPDTGGGANEFIELEAAYRVAMAFCERNAL